MTAPAPVEADRVVVGDRFPANVIAPDGTEHQTARVVVTRGNEREAPKLFVWVDRRPTPNLAAMSVWDPEASALPHRGDWQLRTDAGMWIVSRARGCGCGSPLKAFRPWSPYRVGLL